MLKWCLKDFQGVCIFTYILSLLFSTPFYNYAMTWKIFPGVCIHADIFHQLGKSLLHLKKATCSGRVTLYFHHLQVQPSIESLRNRITSSLQNCFDAEDIKALVKVLLTHFTIAKNGQGLPNLDIVGRKMIKESSTGLGAALWKCGRVHREWKQNLKTPWPEQRRNPLT